jgi:hypothetical protein
VCNKDALERECFNSIYAGLESGSNRNCKTERQSKRVPSQLGVLKIILISDSAVNYPEPVLTVNNHLIQRDRWRQQVNSQRPLGKESDNHVLVANEEKGAC